MKTDPRLFRMRAGNSGRVGFDVSPAWTASPPGTIRRFIARPQIVSAKHANRRQST